jgi:hypothetical protein
MQAGITPAARMSDPVFERLRAIYDQFPNDELADLLDSYGTDGQ